ncbi:MAG: NAD(P)-dependent oxidoreductase [Syntrophobacteraceae bacterium]|nr:NAD(P)-dependent oxidoreductase [Syntrophobacteraceae bacterium]
MRANTPESALITGATGFVGSHLAKRLSGKGCSVGLLVRDPDRLDTSLRRECEVIRGDLFDPAALARAVRGRQAIFHCAANTATWGRWDDYFAANVGGLQNLLEAIARENRTLFRLVHLSTADVYGFPQSPCNEQGKISGKGFFYGETKIMGEELVRAFGRKYGFAYTIFRPANIIGPRSQFIVRIGKELQSGVMLLIDGGRANGGFTYIDTLVDYLLWSWSAEKSLNECYNVRSNYDINWSQFIERFQRGIGGRGIVVDLPFAIADRAARMFEAAHRVVAPSREPLLHRLIVRIFGRTCGHSAAKLLAHSGVMEKTGFNEAMERSIAWYRTREDG